MEAKDRVSLKDDEEPEINYRGINAMPFIIGNETFEKLGALGTLFNLQVYLTTVFNMKRISATTLLNVFSGTTNFATLIGAYLSDTYFGRYNMLGFGTVASFLGLLVIALTAVFKQMHPPHCGPEDKRCIGATPGQMAFLLTGFGLMIMGAGAIRPCNLAFGADQFNPHTAAGKRGVNSFFNWYFFTLSFAQMVSVTLVVYVQSEVNWGIGLAIPAIFMLISGVLFFAGTKIYVMVKPEGSPLTSVAQVAVVAARKRQLKSPDRPRPWSGLFNYTPLHSINSKLPYTKQFRFLEKAAIFTPEDRVNANGSAANPWKLCSMQKVEEVKCILRVIPIWAASVLYHVGEKQQYLVFQAMQSDRNLGSTRFQIPPATYSFFAMLTLTIWLPIYDRIVVPSVRRITKREGGITILQRIGIGIFLTILESLVSVFVEQRRRALALSDPLRRVHSARGDVSSMSALWLVPQLALAGLAEAFCAIGQVEFYYKQFPENMRSIAGSLFFCGMAVAYYLNGFLISFVHRVTEGSPGGNWLPEDLNKGRLDYFYFLITGLCMLNFCYFLMCAKWYRYKGTGDDTADKEMKEKEPDNTRIV